jgi:hypothetical protein
MTQELDKEGLEAAIDALLCSAAWKSKISLRAVARKTIQAYLDTSKVTGFEEDIEYVFSKIPRGFVWDLIERMQAALAGGNTK